jgi:hypothetical protein
MYWSDGDAIADVTNIGRSAQDFTLLVDFYDGNIKLNSRTAQTAILQPGETGRVRIYAPSDANKFSLSAVAVTIGDDYYRVYYDVTYV